MCISLKGAFRCFYGLSVNLRYATTSAKAHQSKTKGLRIFFCSTSGKICGVFPSQNSKMPGMQFEYDEEGGTFFYFLLSFWGLVLIPATYYLWPRQQTKGKKK